MFRNSKILIIVLLLSYRDFEFGHGQILFFCHSGRALMKTLQLRTLCDSPEVTLRKLNRRISRSEGTLFKMPEDRDGEEHQRDSGKLNRYILQPTLLLLPISIHLYSQSSPLFHAFLFPLLLTSDRLRKL